MRKRIFEIIELAHEKDTASKVYDFFMMFVILVSIVPLVFKEDYPILLIIDGVTVVIFIVDYILRWITADLKLQKPLSFLRYPVTFMAIIDLISILPSLTALSASLRLLKIFRLFRTFKVFRVFKSFRYSKNVAIIANVFRKQKDSLIVVCGLAVGYILISALVVFSVEPDSFNTFFDAIYWATVSLTTVGYGDVYCISTVGKIVTMISAIMGVAIVALPAGIVAAGYMAEVNKDDANT